MDEWHIFLIGIVGWFIYSRIEDSKKTKIKREREKKELEELGREEMEQQRERVKSEQERKRIEKEIYDLMDSIVKDWNASIYADKVETPGNGHVKYRFENGDNILFTGKTLTYTTSKHKMQFTLGLAYQVKFRNTFNRIVEIINSGKTAKRSRSSYSYSKYYGSKSTKSTATATDPKSRKYEMIMETIKLRKESLAKMSKSDPERVALENELKVAERVASEMKK